MVPWPRVVEQAAGRGDDDLDAAAQRADLAAEPDAAVDGGRADAAAGVGADRLLDLHGQLARRREDEDPDAAMARRAGREALEDRQHEGGRLAGAGLGAGEQVTAGEDEWNRLALDGSWFGVSLARDSAEQVGLKPEVRERQGEKAPDEALPQTRGPVRADGEFGSDFG